MPMMAKMRSLAPAFIITVGALFVLFMIISDSNVLEAFGGRPTNVGSVNGEEITYNEFMAALDRQMESMRQQGQEVDENIDQVREQVWEALVSQKLIEDQIEKFGITVSDEEVRDIVLGPNPPEFLKQNFIDSLGNFNRAVYEQALFDPQNKQALLSAEDYVKQSRLSEKLQSLLLASITVSEEEIKRKFTDQNVTLNASYALADINQFQDSEINVTDEDLKNYYDKNIDLYSMDAQRKLKYILFSNQASASDSNNIVTNLKSVAKSINVNDTASFREAVGIYSIQPYSRDTVGITQLPASASSALADASAGQIVGPVATPEGFVLYNLISKVPGSEQYVKASHILINQKPAEDQNLSEAARIYNDITSGKISFEQAAKQYSADPSNAPKGGDLGWFGKGAMVKEFEDASFNGKVGEVQKPVKTSFGYHIIKVTGKTNNKFVVEKIVNPIEASPSTRDANFNAANDFAYLAEKNGFEKTAEEEKLAVQETTPFNEEVYSIPGIGRNTRIVSWSFENNEGDVSDVFSLPNGYAVVMISEVIKEGVKPFDEIKENIKPAVLREKKFEKAKQIIENVASKINGDLSKAPTINKNVVVNETGTFTPGGSVPGVGRDFAFIETALGLKQGSVSKPVKGNKGYYIIKLLNKSDFDKQMYDGQRNQLRDNILQEKKSYYFNQWLAKLRKDADIDDNRYVFFGQ